MINTLYIKNLAIIDELSIQFGDKLNIITGETGSGKSLIIKAIQLVLGKKFSEEYLRTGENEIIIEANFTNNINIRRIFNKKGKSYTYINEKIATIKDLTRQTKLLADLHSQHDHNNLLNPDNHLKYLDSFGSYDDQLEQLKILYIKINEHNNILEQKINAQNLFIQNKDIHEFQIKELTLYDLSIERYNEIIKKHTFISKSSLIIDSLKNIENYLTNSQSSIFKYSSLIKKELLNIYKYDDIFDEFKSNFDTYKLDLDNFLFEIQSIISKTDINNKEVENINEELSYFEMLKNKYGGSIEAVIEYRDKLLKSKVDGLDFESEIEIITKNIKKMTTEYYNIADNISNNRKNTKIEMENIINNNLASLDMLKTDFKIHLSTNKKDITKLGIDVCEFYISTNLGEVSKPVAKIASGGELSRIMLSIKMALQSNDLVDTLIFDEIDTGISGAIAEKVGKTINKLSNSHQIICITHLSQIAVKGYLHYKISKEVINNRVSVKLNKLNTSNRINEIASLISGEKITESSKQQAKELLGENG